MNSTREASNSFSQAPAVQELILGDVEGPRAFVVEIVLLRALALMDDAAQHNFLDLAKTRQWLEVSICGFKTELLRWLDARPL